MLPSPSHETMTFLGAFLPSTSTVCRLRLVQRLDGYQFRGLEQFLFIANSARVVLVSKFGRMLGQSTVLKEQSWLSYSHGKSTPIYLISCSLTFLSKPVRHL
jgi:hypothetical protein